MTTELHLDAYLDRAASQGGVQADAAATILALANAGRTIARILAAGPLAGALGASRPGAANDWGDAQKEFDVQAHGIVVDALRAAPVACVLSEEAEHPVTLDPARRLSVAIDPLDGSSNLDTNAPVGTIFSILPASRNDQGAAFLAPGREQVAAGFLIYGANTGLAVTMGDGARIFTLDPARGAFVAVGSAAIPPATSEYAINASNGRHWDPAVRSYVDDCLAGAEGPRGRDFNTRWVASLVADAYRIMLRGGVYLYPGDRRAGYQAGRLRLVYEANPIAFLAEQAGGAATDGRARILDLEPASLHQRVPFVFGSREEVTEVARLHARPERDLVSPLFGARSLFRA